MTSIVAIDTRPALSTVPARPRGTGTLIGFLLLALVLAVVAAASQSFALLALTGLAATVGGYVLVLNLALHEL